MSTVHRVGTSTIVSITSLNGNDDCISILPHLSFAGVWTAVMWPIQMLGAISAAGLVDMCSQNMFVITLSQILLRLNADASPRTCWLVRMRVTSSSEASRTTVMDRPNSLKVRLSFSAIFLFLSSKCKTIYFLKGQNDQKPITVDEILEDEGFQAENNYVQVSRIVN